MTQRRSVPVAAGLRLLVTVAGAVLVAALASGCNGSHHRTAATTPTPTPIARLHAGDVQLVRAPFCDRVPASAARRALGGAVDTHDTWGNGDPIPGSSDSGDVGHELGCAWTGASGSAARAWVFARPVTTDLAATIVAQAGTQPGCKAEPATVFGTPAVLQTCSLTGGVQRDRRAGLFGDTWVTCEVAGPASSDPRTRLDAWCAQVVAALGAG